MSEILLFCRDENYQKGSTTKFAERIREIRENENITQTEMSKLAELSQSTYGTYERSEYLPDAKTIYVMAKRFNVSADYLLCLSDVKRYKEKYNTISEFSNESQKDFKKLSSDNTVMNTFEKLIHQDNFVNFIEYMYAYMLLSVNMGKKAKESLKNKGFYDMIYFTDINSDGKKEAPENELSVFDFPNNKIEKADIYKVRLHKMLDMFLDNMCKQKYFKQEMKKKIESAAGIVIDEPKDDIDLDALKALFNNFDK